MNPISWLKSQISIGLLLIIGAFSVLNAQTPNKEDHPSFLTSKTVLWLGKTQIIPFKTQIPVLQDKTFSVTVQPLDSLKILQNPKILAGETVGYLRVQALKEVESTLTISAKSSLQLLIKPLPTKANRNWELPTIVNPVSGAFVWGKFSVGVDLFLDPVRNPSPKGITLFCSPGKKQFMPLLQKQWNEGPCQQNLFIIDANTLPEGQIQLVAFVQYSEKVIQSNPVSITVIHPTKEELTAGECEAHLEEPRPEYSGTTPPAVGFHPEASQKGFVLNYGAYPTWGFQFDVPKTGFYQMMITGKGDYAAGAFPTVGLYLDGAGIPLTSARLLHRKWHRFALGHPVPLTKGPHFIRVFFMNDFYLEGLADRNLFLDCYELAPIAFKENHAVKKAGPNTMNINSTKENQNKRMVRVAFDQSLDQQLITGRLTIKSFCWWYNQDNTLAPQTTLFINGKPFSTQQSPDPTFWVDKNYFQEGKNTIQLKSITLSGHTAQTSIQTIIVPNSKMPKSPPVAFHRFSVLGNHWGIGMQNKLKLDRKIMWWHRIAAIPSNEKVTLKLPAHLFGKYRLYIEGRGGNFEGLPIATAYLRTANQKPQQIAAKEINAWWTPYDAGEITLEKGKKDLIIAFENGLQKENGTRKLWLSSIILLESQKVLDRIAPRIQIEYPKSGQEVFGADVVIAQLYDNNKIVLADLMIDGKPQTMNFVPSQGHGRLVFPLLLRNLSPGKHQLFVHVRDQSGNIGESKEIEFTVLKRPPAEPTSYERAIHLLNRLAYGPGPRELAELLLLGEDAWLEKQLSESFETPAEQAALENTQVIYRESGNQYHVTQRTVRHLLLTQNPVRVRFVLWLENHFSTWLQKVGAGAKWEEHLMFSKLGFAPFPELLLASATSPAMLFYLDQQQSVAKKINENYAREIMELHTLGVEGGYTQNDVTTLAKLLGGWTLTEESDENGTGNPLAKVFRYDPILNEGQRRTILGMKFEEAALAKRFDRVHQALELLAAHPNTARFMARKLIQHYVKTPAPVEMEEDLAHVFMETGGDFKAMLKSIIKRSEFWGTRDRLSLPLDFTCRILRVCKSEQDWIVGECLRNSGVALFDRATPDGFPEEAEEYANSNALLQRWKFAKRSEGILNQLVPWSWYNPRYKMQTKRWQQQIIDILAIRITGFPLSEASNEAALEIFNTAISEKENPVSLICQLPELNFR